MLFLKTLPFLTSCVVLASQPFLNEPDTGLIINSPKGVLPPLKDIITLPDFEAAARRGMSVSNYSYYRTGNSGEFSYRASLEVFHEVKLRPRMLRDMSKVDTKANILGYDFEAPFFIAPAALAGLGHPRAERNLVEAAGKNGILYAPSLSATLETHEIAAAAEPRQVMFHQIYVSANKTRWLNDLRQIEKSGYKALFLTIDNPIHGIRTRQARYSAWANETDHDRKLTWDDYKEIQRLTWLPVIPKGIQTVEDARLAVKAGAKAIYVSNHGGRQLDTSQQPIETLMEIRAHAPEIFDQVTVIADGGVRYGTDVIKLLALGAKAVGLGRPPMYANVYGFEGVNKMINILRRELWVDMANLGVKSIKELNVSYLNLRRLEPYVFQHPTREI